MGTLKLVGIIITSLTALLTAAKAIVSFIKCIVNFRTQTAQLLS